MITKVKIFREISTFLIEKKINEWLLMDQKIKILNATYQEGKEHFIWGTIIYTDYI